MAANEVPSGRILTDNRSENNFIFNILVNLIPSFGFFNTVDILKTILFQGGENILDA